MKKIAVALHATNDFNINSVLSLKTLDYIHVDVMDGIFVDNMMLNLDIFEQLNTHFTTPIIAHLMVINPLEYLEKIYEYVHTIFFHYEIKQDKPSIIQRIKDYNIEVGIVINPPTPISEIVPFLKDIS